MVDITNEIWLPNRFGGSEKKKTLSYNGKIYMVKFPDPIREKGNEISYINNQFSEYIGCQIYKYLQIPVQNTFLATYYEKEKQKEKIVVVCEDFCVKSQQLVEFSKLAISETGNDKNFKSNLEDVLEVIDRSMFIKDKQSVKDRFWQMFVVDAFIGNSDRHLDNWGFLTAADGSIAVSPVYDCGSALSPLYTDKVKEYLLEHKGELSVKEYNVCSAYRMHGKKILYHEIMKKPPIDLAKAILDIVPKIKKNKAKIASCIATTEGMSDISRQYMIKSLELRFEKILQPALKKQLQNSR